MTGRTLSQDQTDAMRELANIAMGRAASALGQILGLEVQLDIPTVEFVGLDSLIDLVNDRVRGGSHLLTRQAFSDGLDGEAIVIFEQSLGVVTALVTDDGEDADDVDQVNEQMLEITNIIVGAFLGSLMEPLGADLYFTPPTLIAIPGVSREIDRGWDAALVLDIEMGARGRSSACQLLLVFPETSIQKIRAAVDHLLESL